MKKLIVNADDYGLTEGVNRAIIDGHRNGILTSTTLMPNGAAFDSAVTASQNTPTLGVGVHLNLTQGRPVSAASQVPSIVTSDGSFYTSPGVLAWRILTRKVECKEVEKELRSQIEKVASAGIRITHLDSHKHVHLLPSVFGLVVNLARDYGIGGVRCPVEPALSALGPLLSGYAGAARMAKQYLVGRTLSTFALCHADKMAHTGICRPEHFYGLSQTGFLNAAILEQLLPTVPEGTSELMCHPGYVDEALLGIRTRLRAQRESEMEALTNPRIRQMVDELGFELISYAGLPGTDGPKTGKCNKSVQELILKG